MQDNMARTMREILEEERAKAKAIEAKISKLIEQAEKTNARIPALEALVGTLEAQLLMPIGS